MADTLELALAAQEAKERASDQPLIRQTARELCALRGIAPDDVLIPGGQPSWKGFEREVRASFQLEAAALIARAKEARRAKKKESHIG